MDFEYIKEQTSAYKRTQTRYVFEEGAEVLIIGTGHYSGVGLSDEAEKNFSKKGCRVKLMSTPKAINAWNAADEKVIGLFHVTFYLYLAIIALIMSPAFSA